MLPPPSSALSHWASRMPLQCLPPLPHHLTLTIKDTSPSICHHCHIILTLSIKDASPASATTLHSV